MLIHLFSSRGIFNLFTWQSREGGKEGEKRKRRDCGGRYKRKRRGKLEVVERDEEEDRIGREEGN